MMDTSTCTTIVLVVLWLSLCCQAVGCLVAPIYNYNTNEVVYSTFNLSILLLGVCLWQCKKAGYLVSPMTWYHWVLLVLLVILQGLAVILVVSEKLGWGVSDVYHYDSTKPIYGISAVIVVMLGILGGTLFCGWKCNLFCRPCCKSQYICYGSAIVVVLVLLICLALTVSLVRFLNRGDYEAFKGDAQLWTTDYFCRALIPITQLYAMAMIWNTTLKLPYTVPEVVTLITSALAVASLLSMAVAVLGGNELSGVKVSTRGYPLLAVHLLALGITFYFLEYKLVFYWPKDYMCLGVVTLILVIALVEVSIANIDEYEKKVGVHKYTLLGYSIVLIVPTLWYAYRCGLLKWCLPKKKGLKATDTAEITAADSDIATES